MHVLSIFMYSQHCRCCVGYGTAGPVAVVGLDNSKYGNLKQSKIISNLFIRKNIPGFLRLHNYRYLFYYNVVTVVAALYW